MSSRHAHPTTSTHFYGSSAREALPTNTPSLSIHLRSPTRAYASGAPAPNYEEHGVSTLGGRFPFIIYTMLEDKNMVLYIKWYQNGDMRGLFIPNIEAFVANALPTYFPDINKWGSFQKQLNNYGFEKLDRSTAQAIYTHWDNKFQQGRPDLLHQVVGKPDRRARGPARQDNAPIQPLPPSTVDVVDIPSQPASQPDLLNRVTVLENENRELRNMNRVFQNTIRELTNTVVGMGGRFEAMDTQLKELSSKMAAISIGGGSFNSTGYSGPTGSMFNNHFRTNQRGNPGGMCAGFGPRTQGGAYNVGSSQALPPHPGIGIPSDTNNPMLLATQSTQPPSSGFNFGLPGNPGLPMPYTGGQPTLGAHFPQNFLLQSSPQQEWNPGTMYPASSSSGHQPPPGVATGASILSHNAAAVVLSNQPPPRSRTSDSAGSSAKRNNLGVSPVPPPPNPGSGRC